MAKWQSKSNGVSITLDGELASRLQNAMQAEGRYDFQVFAREKIRLGLADDRTDLGHAHIEIAKRRVLSLTSQAVNGHIRAAFAAIYKDMAKLSTDPRTYLDEHERQLAAQESADDTDDLSRG